MFCFRLWLDIITVYGEKWVIILVILFVIYNNIKVFLSNV
jgi:hypothetical protein